LHSAVIVTVLVMGGLISVMWGPAPHRRILGVQISTTAADQWTRLLLVGVELLTLAAVVAWTTRLGDLAPALRKLLRQPAPSERGAAEMLNGLDVITDLVAERVGRPARRRAIAAQR
jgi:hypothetical protein